jgi:GT2 family glycosyltransferase
MSQLRECVRAILRAGTTLPGDVRLSEIILVADGIDVRRDQVALDPRVRLIATAAPSGPAVARNRGAADAAGDLLVFVDSDVVVQRHALIRLAKLFAQSPDLSAAFGAYDFEPRDHGLVSRCKNVTHAFIHWGSKRDAETYWAGLGAVRTTVFRAVGGFDERFRRSSVEDIDFGYRLRRAGYRILLDPTVQGKHLKRWTLGSLLTSDFRDRGIPWTQLMHRYGAWHNDLNLTVKHRLCVVVAHLALALALAGLWFRPAAIVAPVALAAVWWLERAYYRFLAEEVGLLATWRWFPVRVLHHLSNGVTVTIGTLLHYLQRWTTLRAPGALPPRAWSAASAAPAFAASPDDRSSAGPVLPVAAAVHPVVNVGRIASPQGLESAGWSAPNIANLFAFERPAAGGPGVEDSPLKPLNKSGRSRR